MIENYKKIKLSKKCIAEIANIYVGYTSFETIDNFIFALESNPFFIISDNSSESNLLRILHARYDKSLFINDCLKYKIYLDIISTIICNSNYLTDILVKDPHLFYLIVNNIPKENNSDIELMINEIKSAIIPFNLFDSKLKILRNIKRKYILNIGVKDLLGLSNLNDVTYAISVLAKSLTSVLFSICYSKILSKYKLKNIKGKYSLISLGKLGGMELNYSSDIDIIIIFDKNYKLKNGKEYFELLTETIQLFISSASNITDSGFLYRVDFRLRPDGKAALLCRTLSDTLNYYETKGEDWERQMLIKASFLSGDSDLFNQFYEYLQSYIYPSFFLTSPTEQISKLKKEIENNLLKDTNIKLIPGGIRDVEFSVQALQLLNGGKNKEIRNSNTLDAIDLLNKNNLLKNVEANNLIRAYILYRKIEHYQQLKDDKQTHDLPNNKKTEFALTAYLGFRNVKEFNTQLKMNKRNVRDIFNSIISTKSISINIFDKIKFINPKRAKSNLEYLKFGNSITKQKSFDGISILLFNEIETHFFKYLKKTKNVDDTLDNFVKILSQINFPSIFYKELKDKIFLKSILTVCEKSTKSINLICEHKNLIDFIISKKVFEPINIKVLENLKIFKILFLLSFQFSINKISSSKLSELLSAYIKKKIKDIAEEIIGNKINSNQYLILSLGSLSINEMNFASDIDLIFITDSSIAKNKNEAIFQKFISEIKKQLSPFKIDCRLRPEGKNSQLLWNIDSYLNYINKRIKIWELQSFTKVGNIYGSELLFKKLIDKINNHVKGLTQANVKYEFCSMRKKIEPTIFSTKTKKYNIKRSTGGLLDIEFLIQYLIITKEKSFNKIIGKPIVKLLAQLIEEKTDSKIIIGNYNFLKQVLLTQQILYDNSNYVLKYEDGNKLLYQTLNFKNKKEFEFQIGNAQKINRNYFNKILNI